MIRPSNFGFNLQTAASNFFQRQQNISEAATKARHEFDCMVEKLKSSVIEVKIFDDLKNDLPDSVFSNNWMANFPDSTLVIFPMFTENRRAEIRSDIIEWIKEKTNSVQFIDLQESIKANKFLEGTGSIVCDHQNKIAYACESVRTNIKLFESLCKKIGYEPVSFQSFDLSGNLIYHTNVMMTICDKYAMVCFDSIQNPIERIMLQKKLEGTNHEIISLSFNQMNHFAGNCIEVLNRTGESFLLMSRSAFDSLNDDQISMIKKHSQILAFDIPTIEQIGGGSVRCMITGLFNRNC